MEHCEEARNLRREILHHIHILCKECAEGLMITDKNLARAEEIDFREALAQERSKGYNEGYDKGYDEAIEGYHKGG